MTMFTRTDKPAEANGSAVTPPRDKVEVAPVPAPTPIEPKRPAAISQPIASAAPSAAIHRVSVISKALKITGQLESTEDIQIDGEIDGDVRGVSVKVGSNARGKGAVYGDEVEVAGTVDGQVEST